MEFERTISVSGNPAKVMEVVRHVLAQNNFRITHLDAQTLEVQGPGMINNHGNPLLGVSRARVTLSGRSLTIEADLGAYRDFARLMTFFIVGLALFMTLLFGALNYRGLMHWRGHKPTGIWLYLGPLLPLLPFLPWPFLLPLILAAFRRKVIRALETLMDNASLEP